MAEADLGEARELGGGRSELGGGRSELGGGRSETEIRLRQRWSNPLVWRCVGSGLREREGP